MKAKKGSWKKGRGKLGGRSKVEKGMAPVYRASLRPRLTATTQLFYDCGE
jgi:hypothetical protein